MFTSSYVKSNTYNSPTYGNKSTYQPQNSKILGLSTYTIKKDSNIHPLTKIDLESAESLASKLFDYYSSGSSNQLTPDNALKIIQDVRKITGGEDKSDPEEDKESSKEFVKHHDKDNDGVLSKRDFIRCCVRYLCGSGDSGVNLSGKISLKEQLLEALHEKIGKGVVEKELAGARIIFAKYDLNGDQYLDRSEVRNMIRDTYENLKNNIVLTDQVVDKYFSMVGSSDPNRISKEEYEIFILRGIKDRNFEQ